MGNFPIVAPTIIPTPVAAPIKEYQTPEVEACYNSIKATLMHVKSMAKAFDKAGGLGQLTEALEVFSEAKSAKDVCGDVAFTGRQVRRRPQIRRYRSLPRECYGP